jgi:hypothetical protein
MPASRSRRPKIECRSKSARSSYAAAGVSAPLRQAHACRIRQPGSAQRQGDQLVVDHRAAVGAVASRVPVAVAAIDRHQRVTGGGHCVAKPELERGVHVPAESVQGHDQAPRRPILRHGEPPARDVQA